MRKIYCIESQKKDFDKVPIKELHEMIGWIEPEDKGKSWDVTLIEGYFECKNQATAQLMASLEEIKAMLITKEE